ncbi:hypothetical protein SNE40_017681 [Patella caerulea]|uniref:Uncharacterized protein n=1 Tax=Patella caerulea TaxID=87958 RepID=A0AAN8JFH7_PATCE
MSTGTSEDYYEVRDHYVPVDPRTVDQLNSNLRDTKQNLRSLDKMLGTYRDLSEERQSAVNRLRDELDHTHEQIQDEMYRNSTLRDRDYLSDSENSRSRSRKRKSQVKFADDMHRELHGIHGTVRDLSAEQMKIEETFKREMERRERHDRETRKALRDLNDNVRNLSPDPLATRVEKRLQAIQSDLKADNGLHNISTELKSALHRHPSREDLIRHEYLASETFKHKLDLNLEHVKKRLDESEGSRRVLQQQVDDLRNHLSKAEAERQRSKLQMDQARMEEEFRQRQLRNEYAPERKSLEREIHELRTQLTRSVNAVTEVEDLRRTNEKSEKQRAQLSDHIETLVKDLENRDKTNAKLITELKEMSDKYNDSERQKNSFSAQLEDVTQKFRETTQQYQQASNELRDTQSSLQTTEKKKDEFKGRAQETVRQWKMKVKQLENELDRQKHSGKEMLKRNEQLIKEMEGLRHGTNHSLMHVDAIKRELAEALAVRATQDEQLRIKDIEVSDLKSYKLDLEGEVRDARSMAERMESELQHCQTQLMRVTQDRAILESRLSAAESSQMTSQDHASQLQSEQQKLSSAKSELMTQLMEANGSVQGLKQKLTDLQRSERAAREELESCKRQLAEERGGHHNGVESLKEELNHLKNREVQTRLEVTRRFKHGLAEYEAMVNALKVDLTEERSARKILRKNEDALLMKVDELENRLKESQEENIALLTQIDHLRSEKESKANFLHQDDVNRVKKLEDSLEDAQSELLRLEKNQRTVIAEIAREIDELLIAASFCPSSIYQPLNGKTGIFGSVSHLIADVKNKLKWLKSEIEVRIKRESKWQKALHEVLNGTEKDRSYLLKELIKQEGQLEDVLAAKEDLVLTLKQCKAS